MQPLAWRYELAHARIWTNDKTPGPWTDWRWHVSETQPCAGEAMRNVTPLYPIPFNPCLAKLREGEPFFVLLGRDKQAPNAVLTWANDRQAAEGKSDWTEQARAVAYEMAAYSGADKCNSCTPAPLSSPDLCEGGQPITSEPCEKCGATMDDSCGRPPADLSDGLPHLNRNE